MLKNYKPILISLLVIIALLSFSCKDKEITETENNDTKNSAVEKTTAYKTGETIKIDVSQFEFNPNKIIVEKGAKVKILVKSTDVKHGIAIEGYNIRVELPVNEEKTFELIADQTGSFTYYCSVPCGAGHRSMKGTLIVE